MSGALKKTKKRKQKQKPTREDDIPPDLKLDIFQLFFSYLTPVFQGLHIFYCSVQARRKWRWEEEREGGEKGWKAREEAGDVDCVWREKCFYPSSSSNTSSPSWKWWLCGTLSRLTFPRTQSTKSNWMNWSPNSSQSRNQNHSGQISTCVCVGAMQK